MSKDEIVEEISASYHYEIELNEICTDITKLNELVHSMHGYNRLKSYYVNVDNHTTTIYYTCFWGV